MIFGELNSALSFFEKLRGWFKKTDPVETIATRFVRLHESHGVHRNQIPRFIGGGLTAANMQNDEILLVHLSEELLNKACSLFSIRREWLDGAEAIIHPQHDFYKHPEEFRSFIEDLVLKSPEGDLHGIVIAPNDHGDDQESLIILQEVIGCVGEREIVRFHLCNNWSHRYWKARAYLTACVATAWKRGVYIHGVKRSTSEIRKLARGETLLGWKGEGISEFGVATWHPEDMALSPDEFLLELDRERNEYGLKAGLNLWLHLERQGLMDVGIKKEEALVLFREAAAKHGLE